MMIYFLLLSLCFPLFAQEEVELAARLFHSDHVLTMGPMNDKKIIPIVFKERSLEEKVLKMSQGQEALVKGHVTYDSSGKDGQVHFIPVFLVHSVIPLSLKDLNAPKMEIPAPAFSLPQDQSFAPLTIPVTTEVASAITMTTALLLMQNLTSNKDPQGRQQINQGLILFTGILATGSFIFDQIVGQKKVDR